jgi:hypothetical protein
MEKYNIFNIKNTVTNNNYLFVGSFEEIDSIVNKINNMGISNITPSEKKLVSTYFNTNLITKKTKLVKALINMNDTIDIIKKKILVFCGYLPKHQHLWVDTTNISDYEKILFKTQPNMKELCNNKTFRCQQNNISEYSNILGIEYQHNNNKHIFPCVLNESIIEEDRIYSFYDRSHYLLQHYNKIKNNTINLTDYIELLDTNPDNIEYIEQLYFPFIKKDPTTSEKYDQIIKDLVKTENKLYNSELEENNNKTIYKNLVFSGTQNDIDVYRLFNAIKLDNVISFCKYKSKNTNELYKLYKPEMKQKIINKDFRKANNYIVEYKSDIYNYPIEKTVLEKWTQTELSSKEKINKKMDIDEPKDYLLLKIKYNDDYFDIQIYKNKIIIRFIEIEITQKGIKKLLQFSNEILEKIVDCFPLKERDLLTCDFEENINDKKLSFLKLRNNVSNYSSYVYKIIPEESEKNKIYINYKRVNNFTSFDNIRRYFLKIKQDNNLSVSNFKKTWINETQRLFNLSEIDSIQILSVINETLDADELKKKILDIDIKIVISFYFDENKEGIYSITATNCDSFLNILHVKQFIRFLFQDSKKSRIKAPKKEKLVFEVKETKMTEEDEFDIDNDFIDIDNNNLINNNNNNNINNNNNKNNKNNNNNNNNNSETDFDQVQMKNMSVRTYMSEMRKRDKKLFTETYTSRCNAELMRQPILLTKNELTNFKKKNPEGYNGLKFLEWGSSPKNTHFVICPRIWCIRDKVALSDEQFINNNGKCPMKGCQGEVIDTEAEYGIGGNKTIILRRGGKNMYWEDLKQQKQKSEEWKKHLKGTEKNAYPGLLDPKNHPKKMCMPCCFKLDSRGLEKCTVSDIDYTTDLKIEHSALVIGGIVDDITLKENDTFLLKTSKNNTKNNVYTITKNGAELYGKLTKLDIFLRHGFIIHITKGKHQDKQYDTHLYKDNYVFKEKKTKTDMTEDKYVLGEDKFPIDNEKMGIIYTKLDKILNGSTEYIEDSRLIDNTSVFIRHGVEQNPETSFIEAIASLKSTKKNPFTGKTLIKNIIENIEPQEFIGLNNGDLLKLFSLDESKIEITDSVELKLFRWCAEYPDFFYFFINKKIDINPSSLKTQLETLKKQNKYRQFINIVAAFENFKKYCGDMNIPKDPIIFRELLSNKNDWFFKKGLNILIFEKIVKQKDLLYVECPVYKKSFNDSHSLCILYKYKQHFEPIIIANSKENRYVPEFIKIFNNEKLNFTAEKLINTATRLYYMVKNQCDWKLDDSIYELYNKIRYKTLDSIEDVKQKHIIKYYITDEYYKGIGVFLENSIVVFTQPFGINTNIETKKISEIELLEYTKLVSLLGDSAISVILNKTDIIAVGLDNGSFHPVKKEQYSRSKHTLDILEFNYEFEIQNSNNNNVNTFMSTYKLKDTIYKNLKNELKSFFSTKNRHIPKLRQLIYTTLDGKNIVKKRSSISKIIRFIVGNITINKQIIKTKKNKRPCNKNPQKKCVKNELCGISSDKRRQSILVGDQKLEFSFSKCRMYLPTQLKSKFIAKLTEELLFSIIEREDILSGNYVFESNLDKAVIVEGDSYIEYINSIFDIKNMYLSSNTTLGMWPLTLGTSRNIEVDSYFIKMLKTELPKQIQIKDVQQNELQNETFPNRNGTKFNKLGKEIKDPKIKEGKCIFPFKKGKDSLFVTDCILHNNKDYGPICATEVDKDNVMTKYGFCYDNKCSSNIFAGDTDGMGVTHKSDDIKPGRCCFPFIDNSKNNHKEYNECKETSRGPICATSTFDKDIPNKMEIKSVKKGQIKTKGYCPTKKYNLYTKRGKKCVLPFSFKDQLYNRCIDWKKKGKVCPIKKGANGTNIIGKKKGEDFDYCVDEDIDQIDKNEWIFHEGSVLSPKSKGPSILKSEQIFKTVKEAMDECKKKTNCKGVTDDFKTNKITMRWTDNPKKIDTFIGNSWTKK